MKRMEEKERKTGEGGAKIRQREDGAVFILSVGFIFLFSGSSPFEIKNKRKDNEHVKEPVFVFRLGTRKRTEAIGREEGFAEAWGGSTGKEPTPPTSPHPLKEEKKERPPFPSYSSFLAFLSLRGEQGKRRQRRREIAFSMGRAKKRIEERCIEKRERQNKAQIKWHSSLSILSPLSLPSLLFSK